MKKYFLSCLLFVSFSLSVHAGLKHSVDARTASVLQGVGIVGHLGFNAMFAYFQLQQMTSLTAVPYVDNEKGIAEEDKDCGPLCQENSQIIRSDVEVANNINGLATLTSLVSGVFNMAAFAMWATMQSNWGEHEQYAKNINKFVSIAFGLSAVNAFLDSFTTGLMANLLIHHNAEITLRTLAPLQVAVMTGAGYWLPMALFGGYGLVRIAQTLDAGRTFINRGMILLDGTPLPSK